MLNKVHLFYFSPTSGTLKVSKAFCDFIGKTVQTTNLGDRNALVENVNIDDADLAVFAAPVFAGRIPQFVCDKISMIKAKGKSAVVIAVYGNRAYEDAMTELFDCAEKSSFNVIGAGAFVSQHSLAPNVAVGRPDNEDMKEIENFANAVLDKIEKGIKDKPTFCANRPYKDRKTMPYSPYTSSDCIKCQKCVRICPTAAVTLESDGIKTDNDKCILCAACVAGCPKKARIIPEASREHTKQILAPYANMRNKNEFFI